jgi:hypothetical protein
MNSLELKGFFFLNFTHELGVASHQFFPALQLDIQPINILTSGFILKDTSFIKRTLKEPDGFLCSYLKKIVFFIINTKAYFNESRQDERDCPNII